MVLFRVRISIKYISNSHSLLQLGKLQDVNKLLKQLQCNTSVELNILVASCDQILTMWTHPENKSVETALGQVYRRFATSYLGFFMCGPSTCQETKDTPELMPFEHVMRFEEKWNVKYLWCKYKSTIFLLTTLGMSSLFSIERRPCLHRVNNLLLSSSCALQAKAYLLQETRDKINILRMPFAQDKNSL
jgi:REP element-mobilizing transposase RayT